MPRTQDPHARSVVTPVHVVVLYGAAGAIALTALAGCRDEATNRSVPPRGVNAEMVEYDVPNPVAHLVAVPEVALTHLESSPAALGRLPALRQRFPTAFEGSFRAEDTTSAVVFVRFFTTDAAGRRNITNEGTAHAVLADDGLTLKYRVEVDAPQNRGLNYVEVSLLRAAPGTGSETELPEPRTDVIATGEVEVE
jgi:hypothetical protein